MIKFYNDKIGRYVRSESGDDFAEVGRKIDKIIEIEEVIEVTDLEFSKQDNRINATFDIWKLND
jgi:hypothetical protein